MVGREITEIGRKPIWLKHLYWGVIGGRPKKLGLDHIMEAFECQNECSYLIHKAVESC